MFILIYNLHQHELFLAYLIISKLIGKQDRWKYFLISCSYCRTFCSYCQTFIEVLLHIVFAIKEIYYIYRVHKNTQQSNHSENVLLKQWNFQQVLCTSLIDTQNCQYKVINCNFFLFFWKFIGLYHWSHKKFALAAFQS